MRLTASLLAQHFRFGCERQLRWQMVPAGERGPEIGEAAPRPGMELLTSAGRRFERRAVAALLGRAGPERVLAEPGEGGGYRKVPFARVVEALRDPGALRWIVQPELQVGPAFLERYAPGAGVRSAPAQPDLLRIRRDRRGRVVAGVADVKWSREGTVQHYAQVAYYTLLLEEACRAEALDVRVETRWGWLWTRGSGGPRRFPLAAYRHHVEAFLAGDLPRIAAAAPAAADWHLRPRCASCAFLEHCAAEAERTDHLSRVVGLTPAGRRELAAKGISSVRELRRAEFRRGTYAGAEALASAEAVLKKRVQALDFGKVKEGERWSWRMGPGERVRAVLTAEGDPVSGTVFALGVRVDDGGRRARADVFLSRAGTPGGEREMLDAFLARVVAVAAHSAAEGERGRGERALHFFVWDRGEAELLRDLLQRHLGGGGDAMAGVARLLFPTPGAPLPATVVLDVVAELFALPIPHAWDLASVSAVLRPAEAPWTHRPRPDYGWPMGSGVAFERVHEVWRRRSHRDAAGDETPEEVREEIVRTVESRLAAVDSIVRAVRELASRRREPMLRLQDAAAAGAGDDALHHPLLEQLRLFTLAEAAEEAASVRQLHALTTAERARRFECISGLQLVETLPNGHAVFEFDEACREAKFRPGEFALVLTNDDGRMLAETDSRAWLRRKLMVELVEYDLAASPPRVTLASEAGWERLATERFDGRALLDLSRVAVLDRAAVDFNTARVLATLRALDEGAGEAAAVLGLLEGAAPGPLAPLDADLAWRETIAPAAAVLGRPVLNAEQAAAWRAPFERSVSVVWGPPGTGKTYLLAWTLLGLAAAARAAGRPFRVLVSAATHRAIVNVLARLDREAADAGLAAPLRAVKLAGRGSEADRELEAGGVEVIADDRLPRGLADADAAGEPVVVGSTVWSLWKQMRRMNGDAGEEDAGSPVRPCFDLVVIDEASQMKVPDALVALSSLRPGGRVLLAGDDRQLAPIVRGRYPEGDSLFGSAFAHFAARFGRLALRESRRMNRVLVRWPRRLFYPGFVSVDPGRRLALADLPPPADPLDALLLDAFLRPEEGAVLCTYEGHGAGARNALEAELVARLAALARDRMLDPETGEPFAGEALRSRGLAVISPHRAQNSAILAELVRQGWNRAALPVVDTVERMQGNERELILVSYAVADREYAEREAGFLLDPHRFNVSITRARSKLVVFLAEAVLAALPSDERVMTESMAVKGYPAHFGPVLREVEVPATGGGTVRLRVRAASLEPS